MKKLFSVLVFSLALPAVVAAEAGQEPPPPPPPPPPPVIDPPPAPRPAAPPPKPTPPPKPLTPAEIIDAAWTPAAGIAQRPSAAIGYVIDGAVTTKSFGRMTLPDGKTPDANTVYEIGSITKGLTAILLADMAIAGEVSLHDPLEKFLDGPEHFPESVRKITLLQLATHSSGLPRLPINLQDGGNPANPYAHYGEKELMAFLYGYAPPPGRTTITAEYSNVGFGILGWALAKKAGKPYPQLLKERVLEPLGMNDTSIALSADQKARLAPGHARGAVVSNWDLDALAGAGAVRSTINDMTKLLQALMRPPDTRIGKAIRAALEPRGQLGVAKLGLAWITSASPNGQMQFTWHNGGTGGYRSFIGFTTDGRYGIVVLTNGADLSPDPVAVGALAKMAGR